MEPQSSDETVSQLLNQLNGGNADARSRLISIVYDELRRRAALYMAWERGDHTLQPTALIHEVYLRLMDQDIPWQGRAHFFAVAAQVMRNVLVDNARAHRAVRRGGARHKVTLDEAVAFAPARSVDLIALDQALTRLALLDPRQSRIVELRFFGGLSLEEVAEVLDISERTAKRGWKMARSWLQGQLKAS